MPEAHLLERKHPKSPSNIRRILLITLSLLICLIATLALMEGFARVFWKVKYGIPFFQSNKILYAFYPELKDAYWKDPDLGPGEPVEILLLGGSVLHRDWGNIERDLREQLTYGLKRPIRIYNLAEIGHTSRDSFLKYQTLNDKHFDLVIFYHGINEARANNVPPDLFKADYSHYSWYETVNVLQKYHNHTILALPYTAKFLIIRLKEQLGLAQYVSMDSPRKDWLVYGQDIKSAATFESNLRGVLEIAKERNEVVLLMTFATSLPKNYSRAAFKEKALDYGLHLSYVELWGTPENVMKAVARHNEIVRKVASEYDNVRFVDQEKLIPKGHLYFNDVCHLTGRGSTKFVDNILPVILETLNKT